MKRLAGIMGAAASCLAACVTTTQLSAPPVAAVPKAEVCEVEIYADRSQKPSRAYEVVTKAESRIRRNLFFGGRATLDDEGYAELREQACRIGADAVIVEDAIESKVNEFSHVHIWALLVRYVAAAPASPSP